MRDSAPHWTTLDRQIRTVYKALCHLWNMLHPCETRTGVKHMSLQSHKFPSTQLCPWDPRPSARLTWPRFVGHFQQNAFLQCCTISALLDNFYWQKKVPHQAAILTSSSTVSTSVRTAAIGVKVKGNFLKLVFILTIQEFVHVLSQAALISSWFDLT